MQKSQLPNAILTPKQNMINKAKLWTVVMDGKQALIYGRSLSYNKLELHNTLKTKANHDRHRATHSSGSTFESSNSSHHAIEPHDDKRTLEKKIFVAEVVKYLEDFFNKHAYKHLVLIAPPKILGFVRNSLNKQVKEVIVLEIDKDLVHYSDDAIFSEICSHQLI